MVVPVFKRSITSSRSTQNYQIPLITFGATAKSVKRVLLEKLTIELVFQQKLVTHLGREVLILGDFGGK